ncbi:CAP domain-containing protein [Alsobacter soli]|nr:CAP domain-containing protein [Alsobacter soli]
MIRTTLLAACAGLAVLALNPAHSAAAAKKAAAPRSEAAAMAAAISAFRKGEGLGAVTADPALDKAAAHQAGGMAAAGQMSHEIAGSFPSRLKLAGIRAYAASENVAMGQHSPTEALEDWKKSSGHRKNLLMSAATRIGFARATGPGPRGPVQYWALILAGPEPRPNQPPPGAAVMPTTFWWGHNRP